MSRRRPFTDKEHLARAKNFKEEKALQVCIKQLEHEQHSVEDSIVQERKALRKAQRKMSRTSGCSVPEDREDDFSTGVNWKSVDASLLHLRKPWAFTFHETSYNVVYNSSLTMPKLLGHTCSMNVGNHQGAYYARRRFKRSDSGHDVLAMRRYPSTRNRKAVSKGSFPDHKEANESLRKGIFPRPLSEHEDGSIYLQGQNLKSSCFHSLSQSFETSSTNFSKASWLAQNINKGSKSNIRPSTTSPSFIRNKVRFSSSASQRSNETEERRPHSVGWTAVHNTTSSHHTEILQRKRVDSSCSDMTAISDLDEETVKTLQHPVQPINPEPISSRNHESVDNIQEDKAGTEDSQDDKNETYTFFKGRKIRNYVKPHERYKLDPFKMERQAKILRKLAIENPVFLNIPRLDNLNIQLNFSKASRERTLRQLVELNTIRMAEKRRPVINNMHLEKLVKEFCQS